MSTTWITLAILAAVVLLALLVWVSVVLIVKRRRRDEERTAAMNRDIDAYIEQWGHSPYGDPR